MNYFLKKTLLVVLVVIISLLGVGLVSAAASLTATRVYGQGGSFTTNTEDKGGVSASSLDGPRGAAVDSNGNLYLADYENHRVLYYPAGSITATRVYGQDGSFTTTVANKGGVSAASLNAPAGVAVDSNDNLYIVDYSNNRVLYYPAGSITATRVYGQGGSFTTNTFNKGGPSAVSLGQPTGVALDSGDNLYIADYFNNRVLYYPAGSITATRVYGQGGSFSSISQNNGGISAGSLAQPVGVAVDAGNNLYVSDYTNNRALFYPAGNITATRVYGQGGSFTTTLANNGGISADSLYHPAGVVLDEDGNLYVADYSNNRVLYYYPAANTTATRVHGQGGVFTTSTANKGGISANGLYGPYGAAVDGVGNLYVADANNNRALMYPSTCLPSVTVTSNADSGAGSLRQAIADVCSGGVIDFNLTYPNAITLTSSELAVTKNLIINGPGAANLTVSGNHAYRVFYINGTVTISGITIANGYVPSTGGGGIYNEFGALTLNNSTVMNNSGSVGGGGIRNVSGTLTLNQSTIMSNTASNGGGIWNISGTLTLANSTLMRNTVEYAGGGVCNQSGMLVLTNSTLMSNTAGFGGGLFNTAGGRLILNNSTLSGNLANGPNDYDGGGAIDQWFGTSTLVLNNSTIAHNTATNPNRDTSGIWLEGGVLTMTNSIVANNAITNNLMVESGATFTSQGYNLSNNWNGVPIQGTDRTGDPQLSPVADNGGSTWTHALQGGSLALDAGNDATCLSTDQRGVVRPQGLHCDTGAFEAYQSTLTINTAGNGSGVVTPTVGSHSYISGTTVPLTATANTGSTFAGWSGNADCADGSVTMNANKTCTATFTLNTFVITPTAGAGGSITPSTPQTVNYGSNITFTITPNTGYHIVAVGVDGASQGAVSSYTFTSVTTNHTITATFAINTYTLTVATAGNGSGVVTPTVGTHPYLYGAVVPLAATANTGSTFAGWSGNADCADGSVTMNANKTCTATFTLNTFVITPTTGAGGSITPSTPQTVNYGSNITFTITPNTGYHIVAVGVDGASQGAVSSYTFTSVTTNHTITATFAINTFVITPTAGAGGSITPSTPQTVHYGSSITFTIVPNTGYHIVDVGVDAVSQGAISSYTFTNVTADHAITATFALNPPTGLSAGNNSPTALGSATTLTATVATGLNVTYAWNFGDGSFGAGATITHTYAAVGTYTAIVTATNSSGRLTALTTVYVTTDPIAHAGIDQTVRTGQPVTLDGSASFDPGNFPPLTYHWQQTGGPAVILTGANQVTATFTAPAVTQQQVLMFQLTVTNSQGTTSLPDGIVITVESYRCLLPLILR